MPSAMSATATSRNGHSANPVGDGRLGREDEESPEADSGARCPGGCSRPSRARSSSRVPPADLDERDPDYIRESLPGLWLLSSLYFRGEVRGLGNIPEEGPVLLVGNHSGGNLTPDTTVFTLAFSAYFGVERRFYQLAHNLVLSMPGPRLPAQVRHRRRIAGQRREGAALGRGRARLPRRRPRGPPPDAGTAHRVDFGGRRGFIRLALEHDVPIVPVVSIGGQETALFLSRGETLSRLLGLDRLLRLKVLPISIAVPWGINVGDFLGHVPLPAKITVEALPPIRLRDEFGPEPDVDEAYEHVAAPHAGDPRRARRRAPAAADRMRVQAQIDDRRAARGGVGVHRRPRALPALHGRHDALGGRGRARHGDGRALPHAHARRLGRGRRPGRDRRVGRGLRPRLVVGHRRRPARALAPARAGPTTTPASSCAWPTASPAPASWAGSPSRSRRPPCAGTCAARCSSSSARSSTSACAARRRSGARRAASAVPVPAPARAEADRQALRRCRRAGPARRCGRFPPTPSWSAT